MFTVRWIEKIMKSTLHMGKEEANILFDVWSGNTSHGDYAPVHYALEEQYKPRIGTRYQVLLHSFRFIQFHSDL